MFALAFGLIVLPALGAAQYTVDPPTTAAPDTIKDCTYWQVAAENDTCASIAQYWGLTLDQFETYNPSQAGGCDLILGNSYCIEQNWGIVPVTTTTTSSTVAPPSPTPTSFATPLEACLAVAYSYRNDCPRCLPVCESEGAAAWANCFDSVFGLMSRWSSECWQHGGNGVDCDNRALDAYCPANR
ncbi:hypothetical protein PG991_001197 [Apiospora marii]|uniref:LysM domain-containing protein n=1 Tax=Apiospora marii TaxID=335849 RepID=A0ABR1SVG9_9PEZI